MQESEPPFAGRDDEISLAEILGWLVEWGWLILSCAAAGLLLGLVHHLSSEDRFTVGLEVRISDSPLGTQAFLNDVSASFLRRQLATAVTVEFNQRTGLMSLVDASARPDEVEVRLAFMRDAVSSLRDFLDAQLAAEHGQMEESFSQMEATPQGYASLRSFRLHLSALEDGLLESATVVSERVRLRGLPLDRLLLAGALAGTGLGLVSALAAGAWRDLRARRPAA